MEKFRRDLLSRSAEEYRNNSGAMASLTEGLNRLRENAVQLARSDAREVTLCDLITGHHTRLTDVLRHEWAHALADRRPRLVEGKRFRKVFGADYHSPHPVWEHHPDLHLTRYAAAMPCEDYAETFHHYLRHKGRLPLRLANKPEIIRKWEFIAWMAGKSAHCW